MKVTGSILVSQPHNVKALSPLLGLVSLVLLFIAVAPPASSQDLVTESMELHLLEEVIVTAQHRAQDARDVAITISTLNTEDLNRYLQGGEDIRALAARVSGLHAESSNSRIAPRFYIRGLGNADFDLASSQPVSVIMDEVVRENVILKSFPLFDIERVEVLKGPQGTLYGRNTPAGIVKINSKQPDFKGDGYLSVSQAVGLVKNRAIEGAVGGKIIDNLLAARFSFLSLYRPDWVKNDFPGVRTGFGSLKDTAFRAQLLWTPSDEFKAIAGIRSRDYTAHPAVFRASIIGPLNNQLNENFNRSRVLFDESDIAETLQVYDSTTVNLQMEFELENLTITSITSYAETEGTSRGDVDGGATMSSSDRESVMNPAPVPFASFTGDGLRDFEQITEELRLAFDFNSLTVQAGLFLFESDFLIRTENYFPFPPVDDRPSVTVVRHTNEASGFFAQVDLDVSDTFNITGGLRFTSDDKKLLFVEGTTSQSFQPISVSGDDLSWEGAFLYNATDRVNFYGRLAKGFRAPSIQGRGIAFGEAPSTADSETITSVEGGIKFFVPEQGLRINTSIYYYSVKGQQFTSIGGATNTAQLVNANKGVGKGAELSIEWRPNEWLEMNLGYSLNKTEIVDENLRVGICGGGCNILDPVETVGVDAQGNPRIFALVNGNPFPNAPKYTLFYGVNLTFGMSNGSALFLNSDYVKQGKTNFFLYESQEFSSRGDFELGLEVGYRSSKGRYQISAFGRNVTDEANLKGGVDFNNITGFTNEPRIFGLRVQVNSI